MASVSSKTNRADINHIINALEKRHFFKLVCGASLTDVQMVENLSFVFALAGAHVIDLAPTADVIFAAKKGIERALRVQPSLLKPIPMASIQLDKDPHFRKVEVDYNLCDVCGVCVKACPTEAFKVERKDKSENRKQFIYSLERCFGCGACPSYCHTSALKMLDTKPTPKETLEEMIALGITVIEFHFGENIYNLELVLNEIKDLVNKLDLISFSIGSELLSDENIKAAAYLCYRLAGEGIILQCDGIPMSGGGEKIYRNMKNGNNVGKDASTMDSKCLHVANIIQKENLPVYLQISGGTNQDSFSRAIELGININGVAIGSYARKQLMPYLDDLNDENKLQNAVRIAKDLVQSVGLNQEVEK